MTIYYPNLSNEDLIMIYEGKTNSILEQTLIERLKELIKENKRLKQDLDEALSKLDATNGGFYD